MELDGDTDDDGEIELLIELEGETELLGETDGEPPSVVLQ